MTAWINAARYHLVRPAANLATLPWIALACVFAVEWIILFSSPGAAPMPRPGCAVVCIVFVIMGVRSLTRELPLGLALGLSRRSYHLGTVLLAALLAAIDGLSLAGLQAIERATGGWGVNLYAFRVPYLLDGPWYLSWLTSFVVLTLAFVYGLSFGLDYRRWRLLGVLTFIGAQMAVLLIAEVIVVGTRAWPGVHDFFATLTPAGFTGVLAALAVLLLVSAFTTVRRVTV